MKSLVAVLIANALKKASAARLPVVLRSAQVELEAIRQLVAVVVVLIGVAEFQVVEQGFGGFKNGPACQVPRCNDSPSPGSTRTSCTLVWSSWSGLRLGSATASHQG